MDRARRYGGLIWVVAGLIFQIVWVVLRPDQMPGPVTLTLMALVALGVVMTMDPHSRLTVIGGWIVAVALAVDFIAAILDRFGLFGPPGGPGVSWGSWPAFVDYTSVLLFGLGGPVSVVAGALATVVEILLAGLLISGRLRRWVGKATAGLFVVYLLTMLLALGPGEVATYGVPILVGGALLVSAAPTRFPSKSDRSAEAELAPART
ncbi:MAG: hypothetical protein L0G99_08765 [Propionibacteriales bacterium]|nr:hypothetical protein [Propionibacteriales bacterium]